MQVGDLIKRKKALAPYLLDQQENGKFGIVTELCHGGNPKHPTAIVLYPLSGREYEIARSLLECVNENR